MRRRAVIVGFGAAAIVQSFAARAERSAGALRHVVILSPVPNPPGLDAFWAQLRELGYVEGRDIRAEVRSADGHIDRLAPLAEAVVREGGVDAIIAESTPAATAARRATARIPIIALLAVDPVAAGLASSLAHPGGNVTGVTFLAAELNAKRVELMHQLLPSAKRLVAIVGTTSAPTNSPGNLAAIQDTARKLSLPVEIITVEDAAELGETLNPARLAGYDGVIVVPDIQLSSRAGEVVALLAACRKPAVYAWGAAARAGGLMSLGPDGSADYRRLARQLDRILKGATPGDIPFERPTKFEFIVNLRTARALGIDLPPDLLARADEVIE